MIENIIIAATALAIVIISSANAIGGGMYGGLYAPAANYYSSAGGGQYRAQLNAAIQSKGSAVIPAAIQSRHTITFKEVKVPKSHVETPLVEVQAQETPLYLQFKTYSSPVHAMQTHYSAPPQALLKTLSAEEPDYLYHVVNKPVYQEIREIIVPYRRVKQEIRPVVEDVRTVVSSADGSGDKQSTPYSSSSSETGYNNNYPEYTYTGHVGYQFSGPVGVGYASAYKMRGSDAKPYSIDYSRVTTGGVAQHESAHTDANAQTYDSNQYSGNGDDGSGYNNNAENSVEDLQYSGVTTNDGKENLAQNNNVVHYYDQPVVVSENYDLNYITDDLLRLYKD